MMNERPGWDEYFMEMAELTAKRSTCLRRQVGAVIVQEKHIIATGYNGAPRGLEHCSQREGGLSAPAAWDPFGRKARALQSPACRTKCHYSGSHAGPQH